jgi:hypothetical protein
MTIPHGTFPAGPLKLGLLILFGLALSGCGAPKSGLRGLTGSVSGKVTYKGTPVPNGVVTFHGDEGQSTQVPLGEDGTYDAPQVPVGQVSVTIATPPDNSVLLKVAKQWPGGKRFGVGKPIEPPKNVVSIPTKYSNPAQSGLRFNVSEGRQTYDIPLK